MMIASREHKKRRMEEVRAVQSQTIKRAKEAREKQWERTRSEESLSIWL